MTHHGLYKWLQARLRENDSRCMDSAEDRHALATALVEAMERDEIVKLDPDPYRG